MDKQLPAIAGISIILIACGLPCAQGQVVKGKEQQGIIIVDTEYVAKITGIRGNILTLKNDKGEERTFEAASLAGIRVGAAARCEGKDCTTLRIGDKLIKVKKIK